MNKKKQLIIASLFFGLGFSNLLMAQTIPKNEKFLNPAFQLEQPKQFRAHHNQRPISIKSTQRFTEENVFPPFQKMDNLYFYHHPKFFPMNYTHNYDWISKPQKSKVPQFSTGVKEDWVRTYESNKLPGYDVAIDLAIDQEDNVYVTGYTTNLPQGMDFYTIKYDSYGNQVWAVNYNGETNGDDTARSIALDQDGNVYVAGTSTGSGTGNDFVVVKYNSQGQQQWESRFDGSHHGDDSLEDAVLDDSGNVYTTGSSESEFGRELVTVKINSEGITQWIVTYSGPGNRDRGKAVEVDSKGNVYVAGVSKGTNYDNDYATIKYNSEGIQLWVTRYHRTGYSQEYVTALAVDDSGNVIVTGTGGSGNGDDYLTIKYNQNGEECWIATYDGFENQYNYDFAYDLALDKNGNVYVTGSSRLSSYVLNDNFITIKYNKDGIRQWVAEYDAGDGTYDTAYSIFVDDLGYVYVSGYSELCDDCNPDYVTIKYNSNGKRQWMARYDGTGKSLDYPLAMAVNNQGEVVLTGYSIGNGTDFDYATIKYDADGNQQWESRFNGKNRELGEANDLIVDEWGNIYVTGGSCNEFVTIKYKNQGETEWTTRLTGDLYGYGAAQTMTVDQKGNVYVLGENRLEIAEYNYDFVTAKYNAAGGQQWVARYDGPPDQWGYVQDFPVDIAIDRSGNVYVTGYGLGEGWGVDFITIKYNKNGVQQWLKRYTSAKENSDEPIDIAVDTEGDVYVTGNAFGKEPCFVIIKYNTQGHQQWKAEYGGIDVQAFSVSKDDWGNIYIVGSEGEYWENNELIILKYNSNGAQQWIARYKYPEYLVRRGKIRVDELGNVFVTATLFTFDPISWSFVTLKYNSNGTKQWETRLISTESYGEVGNIAFDQENNVYIAYNDGLNFVIMKYNSEGKEKYAISYNDLQNVQNKCNEMAIDNEGNIYVAGVTKGIKWSNFKTIKFSQTGDDSFISSVITDYELNHNFPNPFKKQTLIYYKLPSTSHVKIKIFNQLGQQVMYEDLGKKPKGKHAYHFRREGLGCGIYFYQFKAGDFIKTKKMVLIQ